MNSSTRDRIGQLLSATSEEELCRAGTDVLAELFRSPASIYSLDCSDQLVIRSTTADSVEAVDRSIPLSNRILSRTAQLERAARIDDCANTRSAGAAEPASGTARSALLVPIADWGMVIVSDETPDLFDDSDLERARLFAHLFGAKLNDAAERSGATMAEERLEKIASILSHDLASPTTVARAYLEDAIETGGTENLDKVLLAIERIDEIRSGLEMFARTGKTVSEPQAVDIREAAEVSWSILETEEATLDIPATETILADEHRLYQLLENLFSNAIQHGGSAVAVRVGPLDEQSGLFVEDDGPGVPSDARDAIFEHGYSGTEEQSGFGLSIVRGIVDAHGWEISALESDSGGARFEITGVTGS